MFRMIEIEKYPCNNKQEADKREFEIMTKMNARMNTHIFLKNEDQKSIQKKDTRSLDLINNYTMNVCES